MVILVKTYECMYDIRSLEFVGIDPVYEEWIIR
jgi:hypothetical protein